MYKIDAGATLTWAGSQASSSLEGGKSLREDTGMGGFRGCSVVVDLGAVAQKRLLSDNEQLHFSDSSAGLQKCTLIKVVQLWHQ